MQENFIKIGFGILMIALGILIVIYMKRQSISTAQKGIFYGYILGFGLIVIGVMNIIKTFTF
ncbi:MAG: hypothetical protein V4535_01340 [Bacteroidota bacterium]